MAKVEEIVDLEKLFLPKYLGPSKKIERYETRRLTAPGENYGSLMLAVDVVIKDTTTNKVETVNAVAKMVPDNEFIQKIFRSPDTFKKELGLYEIIVPTLQDFQREHGVEDVIDFFPKLYGGRLGLSDRNVFDNHAAILLENLAVKGYKNVDRTVGFDLETSKLILRDLAEFHSVSLALKLKKPEVFDKKILPFTTKVFTGSGFDESMSTNTNEEIFSIASEDPECNAKLPELKEAMALLKDWFNNPVIKSTLFVTLSHCDFWVNNTLVKFIDGKAVKNKIVDFQILSCMSVAKDLSFFLFVSVQNDVIINKYDELLEEYFKMFISTLKKLDVDTAQFTFKALEREIEEVVKNNTLAQCLIMLRPIFAPPNAVKPVEELDHKIFLEKREPTRLHKEKLWFVVKEFIKRRWI